MRVLPGDSNENKPLVGAEEEEVAKMGCPSLGEHQQLEVVIEESYEFKVGLRININNIIAFASECENAGQEYSAGGLQCETERGCEPLRSQQSGCLGASCVIR